MEKQINYVIGGGPVALITAETLSRAGKSTVMIFPQTSTVENYSTRDFSRQETCEKSKGVFGGTARLWDYQCTRVSKLAFHENPISEQISYSDYLTNSIYIEQKLGIHKWPDEDRSAVWIAEDHLSSISEEYSVIAPRTRWDEYFENLFTDPNITFINDFDHL